MGVWVASLLLVMLYEGGVFQKGIHQGNAQMEYMLQCVSILLTVCLIPFALRLFNLNLVTRIREIPLQKPLKSFIICF